MPQQETGLPIALHLDHGDSFELCKSCIDGGFTSVMIDGSSKSFEDNIALTRQVVEYAHDHGVVVEAELGNEYAYRVGEVDWVFTVEGFNNEKPLIPTGQLNWPVAVFGALGVLLIAGGVVVLTKKKKHDEA